MKRKIIRLLFLTIFLVIPFVAKAVPTATYYYDWHATNMFTQEITYREIMSLNTTLEDYKTYYLSSVKATAIYADDVSQSITTETYTKYEKDNKYWHTTGDVDVRVFGYNASTSDPASTLINSSNKYVDRFEVMCRRDKPTVYKIRLSVICKDDDKTYELDVILRPRLEYTGAVRFTTNTSSISPVGAGTTYTIAKNKSLTLYTYSPISPQRTYTIGGTYSSYAKLTSTTSSGTGFHDTRFSASQTGTYTVTVKQDQSGNYFPSSSVVTIKVVEPTQYSVTRKSGVGNTIYRSLPNELNVSSLFTCTAPADGVPLGYTVRNSDEQAIPLTNGTILPDNMPIGTYYITCAHPSSNTYDAKSATVTLKIVGVYEKNVSYKETTGTGSYSFDTHDLLSELHVDNKIYVWSANAKNDESLTQNGSPLHYSQNDTGNYRTLSTTDLTVKMPNTHFFEFWANPNGTYDKVVDARTEADKATCTEMKTDYIVEYNREKDATYSASGYIYSVIDKVEDQTPLDWIRYTVNITPYDASGFWPVPNGFNQAGGTDIPDDVEGCPLTLGGNDTYGNTAGTNDDLDFAPGETNVFGYYTKGTTPANGNATTIPTTGTYYKFESSEDDYLLTVGIKLDKRCKFYLLDVDKNNGDAVTSRKDLGSELETWNGANGTVNIFTKANHDYYFFSTDEPLAIYGYWYNNNSVTKYYEKKGFLSRDKDYSK